MNEWGTVTFICSECDATEEYGIPEIGAVLLAKHEYTYNGKKNKPSVTVIDVEGNNLVDNSITFHYKKNDYKIVIYGAKIEKTESGCIIEAIEDEIIIRYL